LRWVGFLHTLARLPILGFFGVLAKFSILFLLVVKCLCAPERLQHKES
jgi:hypothetical protein